jgi:thioredoxin:protein disulfide reductase
MQLRHNPAIGGRFLALLACALLLTGSAPGLAQAGEATGPTRLVPQASNVEDFLPPDQAFKLTATPDSPDRVRLSWAIAPGYYLYRSRLKFSTTTPQVTLGTADLPQGDTKHDEYFGDQIVYHAGLVAHLALSRAAGSNDALALNVTYQGCAEAGLCYPPITKSFTLEMPKAGASGAALTPGGGETNGGGPGYTSDQERMASLLRGGHLGAIIAGFYAFGLLLSFTGCVLPTVPILSGIIVGQGSAITTWRAFLLSLTYVVGMAVTYTAAGALTAASGLNVQAAFQKPWIIVAFVALMLAMAASMFGAYTLQMPAAIQTRLADLSNRQRGGTFAGVAVMGLLSSLIVTACMAPALVAALAVISQTGRIAIGATGLFAMSIGMSTPLLLIGTSAGKLLPRAGPWMDDIKRIGGCLMVGAAAWIATRLVSDRLALLFYAVPMLTLVVVLWRFAARGTTLGILRTVSVGCAFYAATLAIGYTRGASDPLHPLATAPGSGSTTQFLAVRSVVELDRQVNSAAAAGRAVMLDFYADWCASCKEMERYTFSDPKVARALAQLTLLRVDVTANSSDDQALLRRFGIYGPPTIAFYGRDGREQPALRVVGYMKAAPFVEVLTRLNQTALTAALPHS